MKTPLDHSRQIFGRTRFRVQECRPAVRTCQLLGAMLTAGLSCAAVFNTDFSSDPGGTAVKNRDYSELIEGGVLKLVDLSDLIDPETGLLTVSRMPLQGSYIFPDFNAGEKIASFTAAARLDERARTGKSRPAGSVPDSFWAPAKVTRELWHDLYELTQDQASHQLTGLRGTQMSHQEDEQQSPVTVDGDLGDIA